MRPHNAFGAAGERRAAEVLAARGYRIVARNVRLPGGEIDLICTEGTDVVFVEVKARAGPGFGSAASAVDACKRAKLRALAADYAQIACPAARLRFDVVAMDGDRIRVLKDAF